VHSSTCARERQTEWEFILSRDKIVLMERTAGHRSGRARIRKSSTRASSNIENRCNLSEVAQGHLTTRERQALPGSSHGSKVNARRTAVLMPPIVEYIFLTTHILHPPYCSVCIVPLPPLHHYVCRGIMYQNTPRPNLLVVSSTPTHYFLPGMTHTTSPLSQCRLDSISLCVLNPLFSVIK
jgi:hypothetical protein